MTENNSVCQVCTHLSVHMTTFNKVRNTSIQSTPSCLGALTKTRIITLLRISKSHLKNNYDDCLFDYNITKVDTTNIQVMKNLMFTDCLFVLNRHIMSSKIDGRPNF